MSSNDIINPPWISEEPIEIRVFDPCESTPLLRSYELQFQSMSTMANWKKSFEDRKFIVDILGVLFGVAAWLGINSTFNELPLLVDTAPEGWSLPSYLSLITQIANIIPIIYSIAKFYFHVNDKLLSYVVLIVGTLSALLMAFFYQTITIINGTPHSLTLFILTFFTAMVGCTSSVLFIPYMGRFRDIYLVTYLAGEGLSGFIPSIIALVQGVGTTVCRNETIGNQSSLEPVTLPARFSSEVYFLIEFVVFIISGVSFFFLNNLEVCKSELVAHKLDKSEIKPEQVVEECREQLGKPLSKGMLQFYCCFLAVLCLVGNGVLPSIQSYSCMPYGARTYHLAVSLSNIANPIACFLAVFLPHESLTLLLSLTGISGALFAYLMTMSVMSPTPLLVDSAWGSAITIISWILIVAFYSYIKLGIMAICRRGIQGTKGLFWCGAFMQIGSAIGAVIIYFLINWTQIFQQYNPCQ